jgi:hypothetical protein
VGKGRALGWLLEKIGSVFSKRKGPTQKPPADPNTAKGKADKDGNEQKPRGKNCTDCKKKPEKRDIKKYNSELEGMDRKAAETKLDRELRDDAGWNKEPLSDRNGIRYLDGKGNSVQLNNGYPEGLKGGGGDKVHRGSYAKISTNGTITHVPLK